MTTETFITGKRKAIEEITAEQKILIKKAVRIMKYYPEAKRMSTEWNRRVRAILINFQVIAMQAQKRTIAAQVEFKPGGIVCGPATSSVILDCPEPGSDFITRPLGG